MSVEEEPTPPRIMPRHSTARPSATGARKVGDSRAGGESRVMPVEPAPPARPAPSPHRTAFSSSAAAPSRPVPPSTAAGPSRPVPPSPAAALSRPVPPSPAAAPSRPVPPSHPEDSAAKATPPAPPSRPARITRRRRLPVILALVLALLLAWPIGLLIWANGKIAHTTALSGAPGTPGNTYLLVGSDSRADGAVADDTAGQRADSILILHVANNGSTALISLPRDTYVEIPGYGGNKLNASFAFGGAPLLVQTVEGLTGLTVAHYVEIGMGGVVTLVDAVGGVNLCLDFDVNDELSGLVWTAGCHDVDGTVALAFARMRYSDPLGDVGRQARQRQLISAVVRRVATLGTALNPFRQIDLIDAGTGALTTDDATGVVDLGRLALAFRRATGPEGLTGGPPIKDLDYRPGRVGSTVLLDPELTPTFFQRLRDGELTTEDVQP